ncbi:MAG: hypothetical protein H0U70_13420 [Tatlockia sp.]|nr:hypothetical protein [Tatlockia sp.]
MPNKIYLSKDNDIQEIIKKIESNQISAVEFYLKTGFENSYVPSAEQLQALLLAIKKSECIQELGFFEFPSNIEDKQYGKRVTKQTFLGQISFFHTYDTIDSIVEALINHPTIHSFSFCGDMGVGHGYQFAELIVKNKSLKSLRLSSWGGGERLNYEGADAIFKALMDNTTLISLDLCGNSIYHADFLGKALETNKSLIELDLSHNELRGIEEFIDSLKKNNTLQKLNLKENKLHFDVNLLKNTSIIEIELYDSFYISSRAYDSSRDNRNRFSLDEYLVTQDIMTRNKLPKALHSHYEAITHGELFTDGEMIESILRELSKEFPKLNEMAEDSAPVESYRFFTAIGHWSLRTQNSDIDALVCLRPFKNQTLQAYAEYISGLLLAGNFIQVLKKYNLEKSGTLLMFYYFRNQLDKAEIVNFLIPALFQLIHGNGNECQIYKKQEMSSETQILSDNEFFKLVSKTQVLCAKNSQERALLDSLRKQTSSAALVFACQSKTFVEVFKKNYPKYTSFTTINHCLLTAARNQYSFIIQLPKEPYQEVTEEEVIECKHLLEQDSELLSDFIEKIKLSLASFIEEKIDELLSDPCEDKSKEDKDESKEEHQRKNTSSLPIIPEENIKTQKEKQKENQQDFLLYACRFLDEISLPLAFLIPIVGQLYLGARLANNFESLTKGNYSFFGCCSTNQLEYGIEESHLDWNFSA